MHNKEKKVKYLKAFIPLINQQISEELLKKILCYDIFIELKVPYVNWFSASKAANFSKGLTNYAI